MKRLSKRDLAAAAGVAMIAIVVAFALIYPLTPGYAPYAQTLADAFTRPFTTAHYPLGTDSLGRDLASRLALAGRITLGLVLVIVLVNAAIGLVIGTISGYFRGIVDSLLMGAADVQLAVPMTLIIMAVSAVRGPSVGLMATILGLTFWVGYARVSRAVALGLSSRDFVIAPQLLGAGSPWVMRKHVVPHVLIPVVILATADLGNVMIMISSFDYLGLGVQPPTPSWGLMITDGQKYLRQAPYLTIVPAVALLLVIAGTLLVSQRFTASGNGLRRSVRRRDIKEPA
ncbi:ABC transporter permease [Nocardia camponoti]|uniref:Glutathione ABC transporter permease GsiD n=1 Tax=Nocardia camponoti TaxID=1616106 RepID=A0A917QPG0_9NOCA|nr:ABC transporter permease [Nocardia camponoti]GGK61848.1 glutathione ABC transporter permease GsiD [Nocardia camponoti]